MLTVITLKNFYSIHDEAVIDMRALGLRHCKNSRTRDNVFDEQGETVLKSAAILGANASGKSNIIKAIDVCLRYIRDSHSYTVTSHTMFEPFKFQEHLSPSTFGIEFAIDGEKFEYGFSILDYRIVEEHLYSYPKRYKALIFKRETDAEGETKYTFSKKFIRPKEVVANTSPYTLFLTRSALMNRLEAVNVLKFLTEKITIGLPKFEDFTFERLLQNHKPTVIEALRYADSDIVDYELKTHINGSPGKRLITYHKSKTSQPFDFESEESDGTRRLLRLLCAFIDAADNHKILIIDELDTSLHPQLVEYAVKLFNKSEKAQLIFSTHNLNLLNVDILRPDQIYFVSKNYDSGASEVYSLSDFTDYKVYDNLRRDYEQGRFNAIPILPTIISI